MPEFTGNMALPALWTLIPLPLLPRHCPSSLACSHRAYAGTVQGAKAPAATGNHFNLELCKGQKSPSFSLPGQIWNCLSCFVVGLLAGLCVWGLVHAGRPAVKLFTDFRLAIPYLVMV